VADIGTGHGILPLRLVEEGRCERVIATEARAGPFDEARRALRSHPLGDRVEMRFGAGLEPIGPGEADVVVAAGMGGRTLTVVLGSAAPAVVRSVERFILQPADHESLLREWLARNAYRFLDEDLVEDSGRIHQVIVAAPCRSREELSASLLTGVGPTSPAVGVVRRLRWEIGPRLWEKRPPLLAELLRRTASRYRGIAEEVRRRGRGGVAASVRRDFEKRAAALEEALRQVEEGSPP